MQNILDFRQSAFKNGYLPLAIQTAIIGDKNTGKALFEKNWSQFTNEEIFKKIRFVDPKRLNTGILARGLYAIDIDIEDAQTSAEVYELTLRHFHAKSIIRHRQGSARLLTVFQSIDGPHIKQKVLNPDNGLLVEVLADDQQFVAHGRHWTGSAIEWLDDVSPATIRKNDLPIVTQKQMTAFLLDVKKLIGAPDHKTTIEGWESSLEKQILKEYTKKNDGMSLDDIAALMEELNADDDYDEWLRTLAALHNATDGANDGLLIAHAWSKKHPTKYSRKEVDAKWKSFGRSKSNTKATLGTLIYKIRQQNPLWVSPSTREQEILAMKELEARNEKRKRWGI